jgi:hypothetical protein
MGALLNLSESNGRQKPAGTIKVPLRYHQDKPCLRILEGCPANHDVLSLAEF